MLIKNKINKFFRKFLKEKRYAVPKIVYSDKMLENKVALITGGSSGIGYAIAEEFIKNGCKVIICSRDLKKVEECVKKLGVNSKGLFLDVTDVPSLSKKIEEASNLFENTKIDILVNSAGIGVKSNFYNMSEEEYNKIMDTNMKGTYFMTQQMAIYMKKNNVKGHILNLSSSSALRPAWTPYEISKWGIKGFTLGAADILSKDEIIVNAIAPGPTATPMLNVHENDNIAIDTNCIKRLALPNEIASLAVYMCSEMGNMIVGDTFYITGGAGNIINRFD